ncbi:MAG: peptidoglycan D,D-transpeptidase FtsI family protein [Planctomycetota bacterium JB042]
MMDRSRRRLLFLVFSLSAFFVALEVRLFHLQVIAHPEVGPRVETSHRKVETAVAARGRILTRHGYVLAESLPAVDVYADSRWTEGHREEIGARLSALLDVPREEVDSRLERPGYVRVLRRPLADGERLVALRRAKRDLELPGVDLEETTVRRYPEGPLAAHVVGFIDLEGRGQAGVERAFDQTLQGSAGRTVVERDALQRPLFGLECAEVKPTPGADVRTTLDVVLQYFTEEAIDRVMEEHAPSWASIVVLDPRRGDLLACASRPTYDPNRYGASPIDHHANRATSYHYTPGSTFKPFMMATVLDSAAARLDEEIDCRSLRYRGRTVHDSHPNGVLTVPEVVIESSNIGIAKLALRLVPDASHAKAVRQTAFRRIHDTFSSLGFGRPTGIRLPAEASGTLRNVRSWTPQYTLVSMAFGHEVSVTPLQLAAAFSVFATGGVYHAPRVVDAIVDADGVERPAPRGPSRRVFDYETAEDVRQMLVRAVEEGTGERARSDRFLIAGKTSTAEWDTDRRKKTSSFAGFAPADDPRLLVVVVVDRPTRNGHSGGRVAAPAAKEILERGLTYLSVPPSMRK